jgi:hypothetical protein
MSAVVADETRSHLVAVPPGPCGRRMRPDTTPGRIRAGSADTTEVGWHIESWEQGMITVKHQGSTLQGSRRRSRANCRHLARQTFTGS